MPLPLLPLLVGGFSALASGPSIYSIYNSLVDNKNKTTGLLNNFEIPSSDQDVVNIPRSVPAVQSKLNTRAITTNPITVSEDVVPAELRDSIAPAIEVEDTVPAEIRESITPMMKVDPIESTMKRDAKTGTYIPTTLIRAGSIADISSPEEMAASLYGSDITPPSSNPIFTNNDIEKLNSLATRVIRGEFGNNGRIGNERFLAMQKILGDQFTQEQYKAVQKRVGELMASGDKRYRPIKAKSKKSNSNSSETK